MKVICVMVATVDGKITRGDDPDVTSWTSPEDKKHFGKLIDEHSAVILGSGTYDAYRGKFKHEEGKLRIVMTRDPKKYMGEEIAGKLEFTSESPKELIDRLSSEGHQELLLTGGSVINGLFFRAGLVDELILTIEPLMFGKGKTLVDERELDVKLELVRVERLNEQGTLLLRYSIDKS